MKTTVFDFDKILEETAEYRTKIQLLLDILLEDSSSVHTFKNKLQWQNAPSGQSEITALLSQQDIQFIESLEDLEKFLVSYETQNRQIVSNDGIRVPFGCFIWGGLLIPSIIQGWAILMCFVAAQSDQVDPKRYSFKDGNFLGPLIIPIVVLHFTSVILLTTASILSIYSCIADNRSVRHKESLESQRIEDFAKLKQEVLSIFKTLNKRQDILINDLELKQTQQVVKLLLMEHEQFKLFDDLNSHLQLIKFVLEDNSEFTQLLKKDKFPTQFFTNFDYVIQNVIPRDQQTLHHFTYLLLQTNKLIFQHQVKDAFNLLFSSTISFTAEHWKFITLVFDRGLTILKDEPRVLISFAQTCVGSNVKNLYLKMAEHLVATKEDIEYQKLMLGIIKNYSDVETDEKMQSSLKDMITVLEKSIQALKQSDLLRQHGHFGSQKQSTTQVSEVIIEMEKPNYLH